MKSYSVKGISEKAINIMIVALVVLGTVAFGFVSQAPEEGEWLSKLFLVFIGAIITVQIVPGLLLLGAMLKGLASLGRKEASAEETDTGKK